MGKILSLPKSKKPAKRKRRLAEVHALTHDRMSDAHAVLDEHLAHKARGFVLIVFGEEPGDVGTEYFGDADAAELSLASALLHDEALDAYHESDPIEDDE